MSDKKTYNFTVDKWYIQCYKNGGCRTWGKLDANVPFVTNTLYNQVPEFFDTEEQYITRCEELGIELEEDETIIE